MNCEVSVSQAFYVVYVSFLDGGIVLCVIVYGGIVLRHKLVKMLCSFVHYKLLNEINQMTKVIVLFL